MNALFALIRREWTLARAGAAASPALAFFLAVVLAFALASEPDPNALRALAPPAVWTGIVLSALLGLDRLIRADVEAGSLDVLALSPGGLEALVYAKALSHTLSLAPGLIPAALLAGAAYGLDAASLAALALSLPLGLLAVSGFGVAGAALASGLKRPGLLIALIVLPLITPVLIMGAGAVRKAGETGGLVSAELGLLAAASLFAMAVGPPAAFIALKRRSA